MTPVAYLVLGEYHYADVFLSPHEAAEASAKHHGIIEPLAIISHITAELSPLVNAAFEAGAKSAPRSPP